MTGPRWTVVVPVKALVDAKSRLDVSGFLVGPARDDGVSAGPAQAAREALALALATDTVAAAAASPVVAEVVLVTSDAAVRAALADRLGIRWVPDPGAGLDAALDAGADAAAPGPVALLLGDLPALRPEVLDDALTQAAGHRRAVVADADGTGTTLLAALAREDLHPAFGPGSFAAHVAAGHTPLDDVAPGLRRDVDTSADLRAASRLGVGPATTALVARQPAYCRADRR